MLTVIGCGNLNRRDDGAGIVVAQRVDAALTAAERRHVTVIDAGTDGMGVMLRAGGAGALILIDASRSGSEPGAIHQVPGAELERAPAPSFNLHDFRWDHALYAGRRMHGESFPRDVSVFLIEAADLSFGIGLTPAVERAAARVAELIGERIAALAAAGAAGAGGADGSNDSDGSDGSDGAVGSGNAENAGNAGQPEPATVLLRRGSLRLPRAVYQRFFAGLDSVLLLPRGADLLILPVRAAAGGGHLLKVINAQGDRAVSAIELLRARGADPELIDGSRETSHAARWSDADAALLVEGFFC